MVTYLSSPSVVFFAALTVNVVEEYPDGMVTDAGTVTSDAAEERFTTRSPVAEATYLVTVTVTLPPSAMLALREVSAKYGDSSSTTVRFAVEYALSEEGAYWLSASMNASAMTLQVRVPSTDELSVTPRVTSTPLSPAGISTKVLPANTSLRLVLVLTFSGLALLPPLRLIQAVVAALPAFSLITDGERVSLRVGRSLSFRVRYALAD